MVKTYLRHGPTQAFGLICSTSSNSVFDGKLAYVPALEDVLVWDIKKSQMLAMWHDTGHRAAVTAIAASRKGDVFAVGYADGSIRLWDAASGTVLVRFNGHKKSVTALGFDAEGFRLASGSQDTDIILWDILGAEGIKRLSGHRGPITAVHFLPTSDSQTSYILSASKDTYLKLWDLSAWHCIETIVGHKSEVWDLSIHPSGNYALSGGSEGDVKGWAIDHALLAKGLKGADTGEVFKAISPLGTLPLAAHHRVSQILFHPHQPFLAIQSHDNSLELFRIRTEEEVRKKLARREKRKNEKAKKDDSYAQMEQTENPSSNLTDTLVPYCVVRPSGKIRSFSFPQDAQSSSTAKYLSLFVALASNSLELLNIPLPPKTKDKTFIPEASRACILDLPGHRTDIRALALTEDDAVLATCSNGQVKLWNMKTVSCIRTIECGYAICCAFLPGDKFLAVGTKNGLIHLLDIRAASVVQTLQAHEGAVWSIHLKPDQTSLASGSADKLVKFWNIEHTHKNESEGRSNSVSLTHVRTLKLASDVLGVRFSPNNKYLAVATLDSTVQVFFQDTLKFYLSLYGHKLPVLSMDISHDSKLLVTCSADKNIKIWGLDFGDCHRSLFAHDESVMQVGFEAESHYFWSVGKDGLLKYWDGDKFVNIQKLEGHHSEVWALALSHQGKFVVTASHDKSIRVWEKLDEPLFLEEEREKELERLHDLQIADTMNEKNRITGGVGEANSTPAEATAVTKQSLDTLMAGERLTEALELADADRILFDEYEKAKNLCTPEQAASLPMPQRNAILAAYDMDPTTYVLTVLEKIPAPALTDALLVLPFSKIPSLLRYLEEGFRKGWNAIFISRVLFFLLRTFNHQIAANSVMRTTLIPLRKQIREALQEKREMLIYNISALKFIRDTQHPTTAGFDDTDTAAETVTFKTLKRKRVKV